MPIKFSCPHCRKALSVKDHLAGKKAQCPACKKTLTIPTAARTPLSTPVDVEALAAAALAEELKAPTPPAEQATIEFKCYYCDEQVRVSADLAGKQTPCPECRRIIKVPLIEKTQPKDWRNVDTRLPAGARRDVGPAPEGAWDTASVGVSRQALVEAQAIPQTRPRLTVAQWIKRGSAVAATILLVGVAAWMVTSYVARNRQNQALAKALQYLEVPDKVSTETAAEVHRAAAEYYLRTGNRGSAEQARNHFQQARAAILQAAKLEPVAREIFLIDLALGQIDLGGDKPEIDQETRLPWDDADKEVRQTIQNLSSPEGRGEALRQITRKFVGKNQGMRAAALASLFPEQGPELLAIVGLEMFRAKQQPLAETLANLAQEKIASQQPSQEGEPKPPSAPTAPSLIALWLALGKPDKAAAAAPPAAAEKERDLAILIGNVAGLTYQGNLTQVRQRLSAMSAPEERFAALMAVALAAEGVDQAVAARPELESALGLVENELKGASVAAWQLVHLARTGVKAGLEERVQATARLVPEPATRGLMQWAVLQGRLAKSNERADDLMQIVDANTPAHAKAQEMIARHNARHGQAGPTLKAVEGWEEKLQPLGYAGVALGLQDRKQ
ncbi:MAG TPA: hypothetical protein VGY58_02145 [Gemmataceae bacterium]|nr:hypothetical protein [Gemmataceae bacterium]